MLSLYAKTNDVITIDKKDYKIDFSFNRVLANMDLSHNEKISDKIKIKYCLMNYLNLSKQEMKELSWNVNKQELILTSITEKLFGKSKESSNDQSTKNEDKSAYSFTEDADFIYASFMKDYGINLIEQRNKMHWNEFKALFVSLSQDTKIADIMRIRSWKPSKEDSKERIADMRKLQNIYALDSTQQQLEEIELERQIMSQMNADERIAYAKERLKKLEEGG